MDQVTELRGNLNDMLVLDEAATFEPKESLPEQPKLNTKVPSVNHAPGATHHVGDKTYTVSASGAWIRNEPRKSRKASHRMEVASRN